MIRPTRPVRTLRRMVAQRTRFSLSPPGMLKQRSGSSPVQYYRYHLLLPPLWSFNIGIGLIESCNIGMVLTNCRASVPGTQHGFKNNLGTSTPATRHYSTAPQLATRAIRRPYSTGIKAARIPAYARKNASRSAIFCTR